MKTIFCVSAIALFLNLGLAPFAVTAQAQPFNNSGEVATAYKYNNFLQKEM